MVIVMQVSDFAVDVVENSSSSRKRSACQPKDMSMKCAVYTCDLSVMLWYKDKGRLRSVTCNKDTAKAEWGVLMDVAVLILKLGAIWESKT